MSKNISPCKNCQDRMVGCHGKEDNKWKCEAWGKWKDAEAKAHPLVIDPLNGYAADKRRQRQRKQHMEKRR